MHWHDGTVHRIIKLSAKNGKGDGHLREICMSSPFVHKDAINVIKQTAVGTASLVVLMYFMRM